MADENEIARKAQEKELEKFGMKSTPHPKNVDEEDDSDEDEEDVDLEDDKDKDDAADDSEEDSDDSEDSDEDLEDEDDEEDEDDSKKNQRREKKIPVKVHNELRKSLREANKKLADALEDNKKLADKLPDDFDERVAALAKELEIQDPEGLKKIAKLVKEASMGEVSKLEAKLSALEQKFTESKNNAPIADEFEKEWKTFEKSFFSKEFPNATSEQIEKAQELMKKLSHTPNVGGKVYKDKDGREMLDPYELDYIFFKNKDKFSELTTEKKRKSMETTRTQKIGEDRGKKDGDDALKLPANPTPEDIARYQKASSKVISERDSLKVRHKLNV